MFRNSVLYTVAIASLMGVFCLVFVCSVEGQEVAPPAEPPEPGSPPPAASDSAQPPGTDQPEAEAKPEVTPPRREVRPSPRQRGTPSDSRPPEPAPEPIESFDPESMLASRSPIIRLASVPNMFGDMFAGGGQIKVSDYPMHSTSDIPPAGGSRRVKISENNKALPMDRVYFMYNHFQNAVDSSSWLSGPQSSSVDRYTIGLEKTFCDGLWSAELRLPFSNAYRYSSSDLFVGGGEVGNLAIVLKRLLYSSQYMAVAAGLGIETPTGQEISGQVDVTTFTLHNDAVHLSPYIGFLRAPNDRLFYQGFLQIDIAANGNRVVLDGSSFGTLSEQNLLYVDLSLGYWLYRNPYAPCLTGLAPIVEYHYATTVQDADILSGNAGSYSVQLGNLYNRLDVSNLTVGLHTELGQTTVRIAGVFPLSEGSNRPFDAEVQLSVNRRF